MNKEQQKLLVQAWKLHSKILDDIQRLAAMNVAMAYGCVRTAETLVDLVVSCNIRRVAGELPRQNYAGDVAESGAGIDVADTR